MNKKLRRCRRRGRACRPAGAQAQTANVTLYGRLNIDAEVIVNAKQDDRTYARRSARRQAEPLSRELELVAPRRARHGIAGRRPERDLPDRIQRSTPTSSGGDARPARETFVGLQGGWGTFKIGYFLTPYDDIQPIFGNVPTLTTSILSTREPVGATAAPATRRTAASTTRSATRSATTRRTSRGFTGSVQVARDSPTPAATRTAAT